MTYSSSLHNLGTNCPETGGELSRNWGRIVQRLGANRLGLIVFGASCLTFFCFSCFTLRRPRSRRPSLKNTRASLLKMTSKCWFQSWKSTSSPTLCSVFVSLLGLNWFWMEKITMYMRNVADVKNLLHGSWNDHLFFERATFLYLILGKSIHLVKK